MYQKLIIAGNLGGDPEMRYTPSGQAVTNFSVATNRKWTSKDGQQQEETVWFRVAAWGRLAEVCNQYLNTGSKVLCEGRLAVDKETGGPRVWQAAYGSHRASFEMTVSEIKFLSSSKGESGGRDQEEFGPGPSGIADDEIPFN